MLDVLKNTLFCNTLYLELYSFFVYHLWSKIHAESVKVLEPQQLTTANLSTLSRFLEVLLTE